VISDRPLRSSRRRHAPQESRLRDKREPLSPRMGHSLLKWFKDLGQLRVIPCGRSTMGEVVTYQAGAFSQVNLEDGSKLLVSIGPLDVRIFGLHGGPRGDPLLNKLLWVYNPGRLWLLKWFFLRSARDALLQSIVTTLVSCTDLPAARDSLGALTETRPASEARMTPAQWARFALDQLFSEKWDRLRREFHGRETSRSGSVAEIDDVHFITALLGAQLQLLGFASVHANEDVGIEVTALIHGEYFERVPPQGRDLCESTYTYSNQLIAEYGRKGMSGYGAIADGLTHCLGLRPEHPDTRSFRATLEAEFAALGETWRADIRANCQ